MATNGIDYTKEDKAQKTLGRTFWKYEQFKLFIHYLLQVFLSYVVCELVFAT